jgi:hypothetical protein
MGAEAVAVRDGEDELRVRRLTLVDEAGRVRATLGPASHGSTALRLYDGDDHARVELAIDANGAATFTLRDGGGEFRSSLVVGPGGETRLHLHGSPAVSLHDDDGQPRAVLALDEHSGTASLACADADGNCCLLLAEDAAGGRLHLFQRDGTGRRIPACDPGDPDAAGTAIVRVEAPHPSAFRRGVAHVALVAVAALAGALAGRFATPPVAAPVAVQAPGARPAGSVLEAEELVLSDRSGTMRARLAVLADGTPLLWMTDPTGKSTLEMGVLSDVGAVVRLNGGESSVALVAPPRDPPSLSASSGDEVLFQAPSHVARFLPPDLWP